MSITDHPGRGRVLVATFLAFTLAMWGLHLTVLYGPTTSADDMRYVATAVAPYESPEIVNRYAHVYGIRLLFLILGSGPLAGAVHGLVMTSILSLLAYGFASRMRGGAAGLVAGIATWVVMLLCSSPTIAFPDITMVAYGGLALWLALRLPGSSTTRWPRTEFAAGLLFCLAFKSKETAIALLPVLLWALRTRENGTWRRVVVGLALGGVAGLALMGILDQIFLGNAFFGVSPGSAARQVSFNLPGKRLMSKTRGSYVEIFALTKMVALSCLLLLAWLRSPRQERVARGLIVWGLISLVIHGVLLVPAAHVPYTRYLISIVWPLTPALGVLAVVTWRRARGEARGDPAGKRLVLGAMVVGVVLVVALVAQYGARIVADRLLPVLAVSAVLWWALGVRPVRLWRGASLVTLVILVGVALAREARIQMVSYATIRASWDRLRSDDPDLAGPYAVIGGSRMWKMLPFKTTALTGKRRLEMDALVLEDPGDLPPGTILLSDRELEDPAGLTLVREPAASRFGAVWSYRLATDRDGETDRTEHDRED